MVLPISLSGEYIYNVLNMLITKKTNHILIVSNNISILSDAFQSLYVVTIHYTLFSPVIPI